MLPRVWIVLRAEEYFLFWAFTLPFVCIYTLALRENNCVFACFNGSLLYCHVLSDGVFFSFQ